MLQLEGEPPWRYTVLEVVPLQDSTTVHLLHQEPLFHVEASLREGWLDAPLRPGDCVNLLADLVEEDGVLRAVCDSFSGAAPVTRLGTSVPPASSNHVMSHAAHQFHGRCKAQLAQWVGVHSFIMC